VKAPATALPVSPIATSRPTFYREVGDLAGAPTLLLLYGFPSCSHQLRRLFDAWPDAFG
jgi:pimeloyl-ACP methyl ester carboxylesterase